MSMKSPYVQVAEKVDTFGWKRIRFNRQPEQARVEPVQPQAVLAPVPDPPLPDLPKNPREKIIFPEVIVIAHLLNRALLRAYNGNR